MSTVPRIVPKKKKVTFSDFSESRIQPKFDRGPWFENEDYLIHPSFGLDTPNLTFLLEKNLYFSKEGRKTGFGSYLDLSEAKLDARFLTGGVNGKILFGTFFPELFEGAFLVKEPAESTDYLLILTDKRDDFSWLENRYGVRFFEETRSGTYVVLSTAFFPLFGTVKEVVEVAPEKTLDFLADYQNLFEIRLRQFYGEPVETPKFEEKVSKEVAEAKRLAEEKRREEYEAELRKIATIAAEKELYLKKALRDDLEFFGLDLSLTFERDIRPSLRARPRELTSVIVFRLLAPEKDGKPGTILRQTRIPTNFSANSSRYVEDFIFEASDFLDKHRKKFVAIKKAYEENQKFFETSKDRKNLKAPEFLYEDVFGPFFSSKYHPLAL